MSVRPTGMGWVILEELPDNNTIAGDPLPGGICKAFVAAAPLNVGDHVWLSGLNQVNKSAVAADHVKALGIVVGGDLTNGEVQSEAAQVGQPAASNVAIAGQPGNIPSRVLVCIQGVCWAVADAAIAVGLPIAGSILVSGRVRAAVLPVAAADSRVIGRLLKASAAAGDVRQVLVGGQS